MGADPSPRAMLIGEVAERTGLSLRTLRHYDEIGLLRPSTRSEGGFRLYAEADLDRLLVIRRMKPLGFSLEAMQEVMALVERVDGAGEPAGRGTDLHDRLCAVIEDARERRRALQAQLEMADEFIALLDERLV